jgi:hypothetical protein
VAGSGNEAGCNRRRTPGAAPIRDSPLNARPSRWFIVSSISCFRFYPANLFTVRAFASSFLTGQKGYGKSRRTRRAAADGAALRRGRESKLTPSGRSNSDSRGAPLHRTTVRVAAPRKVRGNISSPTPPRVQSSHAPKLPRSQAPTLPSSHAPKLPPITHSRCWRRSSGTGSRRRCGW